MLHAEDGPQPGAARPGSVVERVVMRGARARPRAARGPARPRQDRAVQGASRGCSALPFKRIQFTPDLLPGDITGTYVLEGAGARVRLPPGPALRVVCSPTKSTAPARRRSPRCSRRCRSGSVTVLGQHPPAARSVLRARHAEPDRARGHLPAARGAARPLPLPRRRCHRVGAKTLSDAAHPARARRSRPALQPVLDASGAREALRRRRPRAPARAGGRLHRPAGRGHAIRASASAPDAVRASSATAPRPAPRWPWRPRARALALLRGKPNVGFDESASPWRRGAQPPPGARLRGRAGEGGRHGGHPRAAPGRARGAACVGSWSRGWC